jgi:hypothetical protein
MIIIVAFFIFSLLVGNLQGRPTAPGMRPLPDCAPQNILRIHGDLTPD